VEYGHLLDIGRAAIENKRALWQKASRFAVRKFLTMPVLFNMVGFLFRHSSIQTPVIKPKTSSKKVLLLVGQSHHSTVFVGFLPLYTPV
jgi:glycolate oxidase iron-sulfur subunit